MDLMVPQGHCMAPGGILKPPEDLQPSLQFFG